MILMEPGRPARTDADQGKATPPDIKLLYFAWLRTRLGHAEEKLPKPAEVNDVAGLLDWLRRRGPRYEEALRDPSVIRVAVNQDYVGRDHPIRDGDEIAVFPPVTGG
jgi:molybdopterin synthase sulfur carrier subunit